MAFEGADILDVGVIGLLKLRVVLNLKSPFLFYFPNTLVLMTFSINCAHHQYLQLSFS